MTDALQEISRLSRKAWEARRRLRHLRKQFIGKVRRLAVEELERIDLGGCSEVDDLLRLWTTDGPRLDRTVHLVVNESDISDAGIALLEGFPALRRLELSGTDFIKDPHACARALAKLQLELLVVDPTLVVPELLRALVGMPELRELVIDSTEDDLELDRELTELLVRCKQLTTLELHTVTLGPESFEELMSLSGLEKLLFSYDESLLGSLPALAKLSMLNKLDIWGLEVGDDCEEVIRRSIPPTCRLRLRG